MVEDDTNCSSDTQQIIYYANVDPNEEEFITSDINPEVDGIQDEEGNIYPFKRVKLEGHMLDLEQLVYQQDNSLSNENSNEEQTR